MITPEAFLSARKAPLRLMIFDCDGVIVDSEGIANRVTAVNLGRIGWNMTPSEADGHFLGMTMQDMLPVIEARIGRPVPSGWREATLQDFLRELATSVTAIDGALEALAELTRMGMPWRVGSNSSHAEMVVKFAKLGMTEQVHGLVHSYEDVARGKPAPDLYLAAASAQGLDPSECIVIEDSATGARAAAAAGMDCLGYVPHGDGAALRAVGAVPFRSMYDLPGLVRLAQKAHA